MTQPNKAVSGFIFLKGDSGKKSVRLLSSKNHMDNIFFTFLVKIMLHAEN
jgi:hypothetical protein